MPKKVVVDIPTLKICRNEKIVIEFANDSTLSHCFEYLSTVTHHYPKHIIKDIVLEWNRNGIGLTRAVLVLTQPLCSGETHGAEVLFDENEDTQ